ncbi:hypothetical protein CPC08DRAFT_721215 [Agrocybe pediades]|nr:hypothetical protein CPC08DRAFT_721215 [Agrocybe pediades]
MNLPCTTENNHQISERTWKSLSSPLHLEQSSNKQNVACAAKKIRLNPISAIGKKGVDERKEKKRDDKKKKDKNACMVTMELGIAFVRRTAKIALVLSLLQGKTVVSQVGQDVFVVAQRKKGMGNDLTSNESRSNGKRLKSATDSTKEGDERTERHPMAGKGPAGTGEMGVRYFKKAHLEVYLSSHGTTKIIFLSACESLKLGALDLRDPRVCSQAQIREWTRPKLEKALEFQGTLAVATSGP